MKKLVFLIFGLFMLAFSMDSTFARCPGTPQADCSKDDGCIFEKGMCRDWGCRTRKTEDDCGMPGDCLWDKKSDPTNPAGYCREQKCGDLLNENDCSANATCHWNKTHCLIKPCEKLTSHTECSKHSSCQWSTRFSECEQKG
jgi:hypothetical protein